MKKLLLPLVMSLMTITSQAQTYHLDTNNDGSIELTDALIIINYILGKFNPEDAQQPQSYLACPDDHHPHLIDLGLPSGTKWACCNVGATTPESYGGYYAWGETEEKDTYTWSNYIHCDGSQETCHDLGSDIASTQYDVAHVKWGGSWVMPSREQIDELLSNCTFEWTTMSGVNGEKFTSKANGGSIFLPAAGFHVSSFFFAGSNGNCWSSTQDPLNAGDAIYLKFNSDESGTDGYYGRHYGRSVRPVTDKVGTKTYHFDVNNDGEIELTDALIIINYILGKFVPEGEWYMVAKTSDSDTELVPVKEVGSLVAVDDALDFTILGTNGDIILEKVLRADFKPLKDLDSTEVSLLANRQASIPAKAKGVKKAAKGQCSFVVADRKGSNNLIQGLTFQHDKKGSSWTGDGLSGSIRDLQYIARTRTELATASGEEVMRTLEALSGTGQADAEAVAVSLNNNPNVEEAFSEDGINLCVKTDSEDGYVMFPMYEMAAPFGDGSIDLPPVEEMPKALAPMNKAFSRSLGNVAIFNYFDGQNDQENYLQQNIIVRYIKSMFKAHGYNVHYFGSKNEGEDKVFTQGNFEDVIRQSDQYKAIIIMSHGGLGEYGHSYITTRDEPIEGGYYFSDPYEKEYYRMIPVEETLRDVYEKCIVYIGACSGVPTGGFEKYDKSFPNNTKSCAIGWEGPNCIAQAHAALFFHYLLYDQWSVAEALRALPKKDPKYKIYDSQMHYSQYGGGIKMDGNEELRPQFSMKYKADIKTAQQYVYKKDDYYGGREQLTITYRVLSDDPNDYPVACRIYFKNILTGYIHIKQIQVVESNKEYSLDYDMSKVYDGCHDVIMEYKNRNTGTYMRVPIISPAPILVSKNFHRMYALPEVADDQMPPSILGSDGQPVTEITIPAGTTQTYQLDAYPGHTFDTPCLDKDVATVSLSSTTLTVNGVSEGTTFFGVFDRQNNKMTVINVNVTAGGASYLSCPDDHHPHLIDLGLPSGTKWACCNVGADKPEAYGGYYAWGETEEKSSYDEDTYEFFEGYEFYTWIDDYGEEIEEWLPIYMELDDIAGTMFDAATMNWEDYPWRMPSIEEFEELVDNCSYEWTTVNGINGGKFTSMINGGSIFLPAADYRHWEFAHNVGEFGYYWTSSPGPWFSYDPGDYYSSSSPGTLYSYDAGDYKSSPKMPAIPSYPGFAYNLFFYSERVLFNFEWGSERYYGYSVRPVLK